MHWLEGILSLSASHDGDAQKHVKLLINSWEPEGPARRLAIAEWAGARRHIKPANPRWAHGDIAAWNACSASSRSVLASYGHRVCGSLCHGQGESWVSDGSRVGNLALVVRTMLSYMNDLPLKLHIHGSTKAVTWEDVLNEMGPLSGPNGSVVDYLTAAELHVVTKSSALRTNTRHRYTVAVEEYDVLHVRYLFSVLMSLGAAVSEGASREPLEILLRRVRVATSQYGRVLEEVPYGSAPGGSTRDFAAALDRNFGDMAPVWLLTATAAAYWEAYGEKNVGNSGAWWAIELCSVLAVFKPTVLTEARWEGWHHFEVSDFGQTSSISQIVESRKWQPVDTAVAAMALANNRVKTAKIEWCATPDAARDEDYLNISHAH